MDNRKLSLERRVLSLPIESERLLYSILTTQSNDTVRPIHTQAMPVILTTSDECETWMKAPADEALTLQRPLPNEALGIVASGDRKDEAV